MYGVVALLRMMLIALVRIFPDAATQLILLLAVLVIGLGVQLWTKSAPRACVL